VPRLHDRSAWLNLFGELGPDELRRVATGRFPTRVIEETIEDLEALAEMLTALGVVVHQVSATDHAAEFGAPSWRANGFYSYCPRDLALVVGSMIIETPSPMRSRYFETFGLKPLFQQYMLNGSTWISAPKPQLTDELFLMDRDGRPVLGELEPVFEAANVLRCGRDLFYQVSTSGNELGRIWLENTLRAFGDFTVHALRDIYRYTHLDSTIALIRPGLVLLNPERVTEANVPEILRRWDIAWCPPMADVEPGRHPLSSPWIGMNLLMVNPDLAIVDGAQTELIRMLERRGITVAPHVLRHARTLGGGFHCVTLDTVRDGMLASYFD
jgi:glycine amidinotransferase/scyllo-inosamine-4-phosphate amidinotransferase 1